MHLVLLGCGSQSAMHCKCCQRLTKGCVTVDQARPRVRQPASAVPSTGAQGPFNSAPAATAMQLPDADAGMATCTTPQNIGQPRFVPAATRRQRCAQASLALLARNEQCWSGGPACTEQPHDLQLHQGFCKVLSIRSAWLSRSRLLQYNFAG